jgi:DNA-directed RNA polymerase specialized sigma24 family protein
MPINRLQETEQGLAPLIQQGSKQAFADLYDKYAPALFGVIHGIVGNEKQAGDILQLAFLEIWKLRGTYNPSSERLFNWMMRIARDLALQAGTANRNSEISGRSNYVNGAEPQNETAAKYKFPEKEPGTGTASQNEALYLIYYKGYTLEEAAKELGTTTDSLHSKLSKAVHRFNDTTAP